MRNPAAAVSLLFSLALFPSFAPAQAIPGQFDIAPVKDSVAKLKQFPDSIRKVQEVVQKANFGPFEISGECGFDVRWYCFWQNCQVWKWSWKFPGYQSLRTSLSSRYGAVLTVASQFDQGFLPVRNWLTRTVPDFSRELDAAAARMEAAQRVLSNAQSTPAAKTAAKNDIVQTLAGLNKSLGQGSGQLQVAMSGMARFNEQLSGAIRNVDGARQAMEGMLVSDENQLNSQMKDWPCGKDDVINKYRGIANSVRDQFDGAINAGKNFGIQSVESDKAVSKILGTILNFHAAYTAVLDSLQSASVTPSVAVQRLHLDVAKDSWNELAKYAQQQFGN